MEQNIAKWRGVSVFHVHGSIVGIVEFACLKQIWRVQQSSILDDITLLSVEQLRLMQMYYRSNRNRRYPGYAWRKNNISFRSKYFSVIKLCILVIENLKVDKHVFIQLL